MPTASPQQQLGVLLQRSFALHQRGELKQAQSGYRQILKLQADHFDALQLSASIFLATNNPTKAVELYRRAIKINATDPDIVSNLGVALQALNQHEKALAAYDKALSINPKHAISHNNRGAVLQKLQRFEDAAAAYKLATENAPDYSEAHHNLANTLKYLGRVEQAILSYDQALACQPWFAEAHHNRGIALASLSRFELALASYDQAILIQPDFTEAYNNRGVALAELGDLNGALASYARAIALKPDNAQAFNNQGVSLERCRQYAEASFSYTQAIKLKPDFADAHNNLGVSLEALGRPEEALMRYEAALKLRPDYVDAHMNRGNILLRLKRFEPALDSYQCAHQIAPNRDFLIGQIFHTKMMMCDWQAFDQQLDAITQKIAAGERPCMPFPLLAMIDSPEIQRRCAQNFITDTLRFTSALGPIAKRKRRGKIRLGYYSADLQEHATAYLMAEFFELHDKAQFELYAFSFGPDREDPMRARLRQSFHQFIDVKSQSDQAVAQLSRDLGIDIAVDLKGFTVDCRTAIFAHRAAPIQVSYLGYPGSMAAEFIDYLIADTTLIPSQLQAHYSEKLVYLPNSYQVNDRQRKPSDLSFSRADAGLPATGFVYCCFNNNFKMTPACFEDWMKILKAVEDSVLWLFEDNHAAMKHLKRAASQQGVDPARLVFAQRLPLADHLARHRLADLFLDTRPYNAHTTASDALWAGLPVLTQIGESFASRVASSLLQAVGLPELITQSSSEYVALAIALAKAPERLWLIKQKLVNHRLQTPLFDTPRTTKSIEASYLQMINRYDADLPLSNIVLPP